MSAYLQAIVCYQLTRAELHGFFVLGCLNNSSIANLCPKRLPGEISDQNIPLRSVYLAGSAGYITLANMNLRALAVAAIAAISAIAVVSMTYIFTFGTTRSRNPELWGQFGDYFGGVLNPLFALAAFLSALWSIGVQQREARAAAKQLAEQTELARKELDTLSSERLGEEFLHVIRDIDQRLSDLLQTVVSPAQAPQTITISQMVAEADRLATSGGSSSVLTQFVKYANEPGSVVEAPVREIKYLVSKLREFLEHYSKHKATGFAPVLVYYSDKTYQLMNMLEAVGGMPPDTRAFFATVGDLHG